MFLTRLPGTTNYAQRGNPDIPPPLHTEGRPQPHREGPNRGPSRSPSSAPSNCPIPLSAPAAAARGPLGASGAVGLRFSGHRLRVPVRVRLGLSVSFPQPTCQRNHHRGNRIWNVLSVRSDMYASCGSPHLFFPAKRCLLVPSSPPHLLSPRVARIPPCVCPTDGS